VPACEAYTHQNLFASCGQVDVSDVDEDEDKEKDNKPKTKKIKQTKKEWELVNDTKAIWVRPASDVTDEEYNNFFKSLTKEFDDPLEKVRLSFAFALLLVCFFN
jgi:HSP90 family molecular chaperone